MGAEMSIRQSNGETALNIVRLYSKCRHCGKRNWKVVRGDQHGIDLQCRKCKRFAEVKGIFCGKRIKSRPRPSIPGGAYSVWEGFKVQKYDVDLYVVPWDEQHRYVV